MRKAIFEATGATRTVTWVAIAVSAAALGFFLGGWVYELGRERVLAGPAAFVERYQDLIGALLGATGTIFAGWLAWRSVRIQIEGDEARRRSETVSRLAAIASDLLHVSTLIREPASSHLAEQPLAMIRGNMSAIDAVSLLLAHYVRLVIAEAQSVLTEERLLDYPPPGQITGLLPGEIGRQRTLGREAIDRQRPGISFRLGLVSEATGKAADAFAAGRPVLAQQALTLAQAEEIAADSGCTTADLEYLIALIDPKSAKHAGHPAGQAQTGRP